MCGICGVIQIGGSAREVIEPNALERMTDAMTHRGPDDRGTFAEPGVAFGVRRLSIVDVEGGHQPFSSEDESVVAIQNGELYNHVKVRHELISRGHSFRSRCDTEILPHLYEDHGDEFPRELRGMFGAAVWDRRRRRAVIARDRLGVKPLYWARRGDCVVFASELKSLLASGLIEPTLDYEAIASFLTFGFVPAPRTPLAGVHKLMPGHRLVVGEGRCEVEQYWSYPQPEADRTLSASEHAEQTLEALEESVRMRLMGDAPVGAMLSGGLDSSLVVALMARNTSQPVKTFSIGLEGAGKANELADARKVADLFGAEHHELELRVDDDVISLEDLVWSLDEPVGDLSSLGFHVISELASQHVKVTLTGQGADELFGGYRKHRVAAMADQWRKLPSGLRSAGAFGARHLGGELRRIVTALEPQTPEARLVAMSSMLEPELRRALFAGPLAMHAEEESAPAVAAILRGLLPGSDALSETLFVDAQFALADDMLHYFDRTSMAHSHEVRVPFLDHEFVELCARIPSELKIRGRTTKYLLKEIARSVLPSEIIDKPKIGFFRGSGASTRGWLDAGAERSLAHYLLDPAARTAEFLDRGTVEALVASHAKDGRRANRLLISLLLLEIWLATYLPRATAVVAPSGRPFELTT
jgi:asparagine synthase (glutamine-hydrolysing)